MTDFRNLKVWQKSIDYSINIYKVTDLFPKKEIFSLTDQLRRCSLSIASNIAEGSSRSTDKDFKNFLHMALGSLSESQSQLIVSNKLNYIDDKKFHQLFIESEEIKSMLIGFIKKLT